MINTFTKKLVLTSVVAGAAGLFVFSHFDRANAEIAEFSSEQKDAIGEVVRDYLIQNPKVIFEAIEAHRSNEEKKQQEAAAKAIDSNLAKLTMVDAPSIGPADADVTVIEFFDYNCGYCKRALPDIRSISQSDKNVRFVFKEMPILGPTSMTAAKWAMSAHKQDKYFEFHSALMEHRGPKEEKQLSKIAKDLGLDVDQMKKDAASDEICKMVQADIALAREIGINGTPAFIVGNELFPGYIGEDAMKQAIAAVRQKK